MCVQISLTSGDWNGDQVFQFVLMVCSMSPNAKLTDDEERDYGVRIRTTT